MAGRQDLLLRGDAMLNRLRKTIVKHNGGDTNEARAKRNDLLHYFNSHSTRVTR